MDIPYSVREAEAKAYYEQSLRRVNITPEPKGQKFHIGERVWITNEKFSTRCHFTIGRWATVQYTYAHAYGGDNIEDYSLDIDGKGSSAWYPEWILTRDGSDVIIPEDYKHYEDKCNLCKMSKLFAKKMSEAIDKAIVKAIN